MNLTDMTIEEMCTTTERQLFDRKSAKIDVAAIAIPMIAFANADGGLLAVGIEDNGEITGIDAYTSKINEILRAGYDFCQPSIFIEKETVDCIDSKGNPNHILLIKVPKSADMHVQSFFPRSRVRFIRYEGTEAKVGAEMNVIKDVIFEGRILELVEQAIEYVRIQIKEHTYLGPDARFVTEPETERTQVRI